MDKEILLWWHRSVLHECLKFTLSSYVINEDRKNGSNHIPGPKKMRIRIFNTCNVAAFSFTHLGSVRVASKIF